MDLDPQKMAQDVLLESDLNALDTAKKEETIFKKQQALKKATEPLGDPILAKTLPAKMIADQSMESIAKANNLDYDYATGKVKKKKHPIPTEQDLREESHQEKKRAIHEKKEKIKSKIKETIDANVAKTVIDNQNNNEINVEATENKAEDAIKSASQELDYSKFALTDGNNNPYSNKQVVMQTIANTFYHNDDLQALAESTNITDSITNDNLLQFDANDIANMSLLTDNTDDLTSSANDDSTSNSSSDTTTEKSSNNVDQQIDTQTETTNVAEMNDILNWQLDTLELQPLRSVDPSPDNIYFKVLLKKPSLKLLSKDQEKELSSSVAKRYHKALNHLKAKAKSPNMRANQMKQGQPARWINLRQLNRILENNNKPVMTKQTIKVLDNAKHYNLNRFVNANPLYFKTQLFDKHQKVINGPNMEIEKSDYDELQQVMSLNFKSQLRPTKQITKEAETSAKENNQQNEKDVDNTFDVKTDAEPELNS